MDPFTLVILAGLAGLILWVVLVGRFNQGSPLDQFGLRSAREITESRDALEAEDLDQMLEAANERRRKRGLAEVTAEDVELQVMRDREEQAKRREEYLADRELDELLEATNARRRARGLPERTRDEVRREYGEAGEAGPSPAP